jgi:hypothetical protein
MDVPSGEFESHQVDHPYFLGQSETKVRLNVLETRLHDKWAPMVSLCLYETKESPKPEVCLQFVEQDRDGVLQARQYARIRGENTPSISNLDKKFSAAGPLRISIRESKEETAFLVNDERLVSVPGASHWKRLEYSCASALCRFEFQR